MVNNSFLALAIVFIASFFLSRLIKKARIPTITAYVALGILFSPDLFDLIPQELLSASDFLSNFVLGMIAFSLGESFSTKTFRQVGKAVTGISISASLFPWVFVTFAFWLIFKQPFYIALVLGAISSATDPATTVAIAKEYRSKGEYTDTLLGIVAIDDAWALILFGLSLSLASSFMVPNKGFLNVLRALVEAFTKIGGPFFYRSYGSLVV